MTALAYAYEVDGVGLVRAASGETWMPAGKMLLDGVRRTTWLGPFDACERDLLRVMGAVLDADRLSPRRPRQGPRVVRDLSWQRALAVRIAVEDPSRWKMVQSSLSRLLHFMTDDAWELSFIAAPPPKVQQLLPQVELRASDEVALFSGGLDSVAGLYARSQAKGGRFIAVSACGTDVRGHAQASALAELRTLGVDATCLKLVHQLRATHRNRGRMEASQRSRGLLFLAMGAAAASRLARAEFSVYETGVGCINLPMCAAQVSAQGTRAMHPHTIALFNELVRGVLDRPVRAVVPFFLQTKAELCRSAGPALARLVGLTMSCDEGEGHKTDAMEHCGACTSCLFRRIAIFSANGVDPTHYRDLLMRRHGLFEQVAFRSHAQQLLACKTFADLVALDPNVRFSSTLPLENPIAREEAEHLVLAMYRRYAAEIVTFFEEAPPRLSPRAKPARKEKERALFAAAR